MADLLKTPGVTKDDLHKWIKLLGGSGKKKPFIHSGFLTVICICKRDVIEEFG